ncbi:MAG: VWA domain-containing protein [Cardiobacteriaceae bacterium]|nr:VWA domain-containing protein [Cardiobacteriaceae bacterium]
MRRLPIYLLVDTSSSMIGQPIAAVREGLHMMIEALRSDPYALETAYISVITFDSTARQTTPLTDLMSFQEPTLNAAGCTEMGKALLLLADCVKREVKTGNAEEKADWRPLAFILTDGEPTDDIQPGINAIQEIKFGVFVACAAGESANTDTLKRITPTVISLNTADAESIKAFFQWVSKSVSVNSKKVNLNKQESNTPTNTESSASSNPPPAGDLGDLPPPPPEINVVL